MTGIRKKTLFGCYILATVVVLLYVLFPTDAVKDYLADRFNRNVSNVQVAIGSLGLRFPPSLSLREVTIFNNDATLLSVDRLRLSPRWLSLFSSRKGVRFRGQTCQGDISGSAWAEPNDGGQEASAAGTFSEIRLGLLQVLQEQSRLGLAGTLSGSFQIEVSSMQPVTGSGSIVVSDCSLALSDSLQDIQRLLNIQQLGFQRITADIDLEGSSLAIQNGVLEGSELSGTVSGSIFLESPVSRSDMDLEIAVTLLHSSTLSEINEVTFRATGTFENPRFDLVPAR